MVIVKLQIAYDGTDFVGWQRQNLPGANNRSVQGELEKVLRRLLQQAVSVQGAGRTDSGVHAMGNVAVFDTESLIPAEKFSYALNQRLPEDIRIQGSEEVPGDFHPRHCVSRKTYEYRIYSAPFAQPVRRLYSHFTYVPLDVERMRQGA